MVKQISQETLELFGVSETPGILGGGQGTSILAGGVVFKPIDYEEQVIWTAEVMSSIKQDGFRVAKPIKAKNGKWIVNGWQAYEYVSGQENKSRWKEKIITARKFHRALKSYRKPDFIEKMDHPWGVADRMVWDEQPLRFGLRLQKIMDRLLTIKRPIKMESQLIHGDLTGNILFDKVLPPAVIDLSPYFRPVEYANCIIVVDSIVWDGAGDSLLYEIENNEAMNQLLIRATMWRILTKELYLLKFEAGNIDEVDAYQHLIDLLVSRDRIGG